LSGEVIGFVVRAKGMRPICISGGIVWFDGSRPRFNALGRCRLRARRKPAGPFHLTMDTNDSIENRELFRSVHTDGWAHFRQNAADLRASFDTLGFFETAEAASARRPHDDRGVASSRHALRRRASSNRRRALLRRLGHLDHPVKADESG